VTALRVTTAAESAARDQAAIAAGVPSFDLMRNAGSASAALILREYSDRLAHGVALLRLCGGQSRWLVGHGSSVV
jgi:NAD(P)H-hydrate epimerase